MMPTPRTDIAAQSTILCSHSTRLQFYIPIPQQLVMLLSDTPLALGLYALIARLYFVAHAPVALSRGDIRRYDPALKEGAIKRALDRLVAGGWIVETPGHKCRYTPSWGPARDGTPRPWRIGADYLGCPRHVFTLRLDRDILDLYMGRLTPQPHTTALVERYITAPLLSLRDVGTYLLIQAGQQALGTPALLRWNLVRDGQAQPVPDAAQLLALASQRQLDDASAIEFTPAGWRKLGLSTGQRTSQEPPSSAQPLFFVPPELIGALIPPSIGALIGHASQVEEEISAPEWAASDSVRPSAIIQRSHGESREQRDHPPTPRRTPNRGDGELARRSKKESRRRPALPQTESAHLLASIGVLPEVVVELANTPIERVEQAIAHGQARPEVRDLAGWVVKLLRTARDYGWAIPQRTTTTPPLIDIDRYTSGAYGDLFRRGSDIADLEPTTEPQNHRTTEPSMGASSPSLSMPGAPSPAHLLTRSPAHPLTPDPRSPIPDDDLTQQVREQLGSSCDRQHRGVIQRLHIHVAGDTTLIRYATPADAQIVQDQLLGAIRLAIAELGAPPTIRLTARAPQGEPAHRAVSVAGEQYGSGVAPQPPGPSMPGAVANSSP